MMGVERDRRASHVSSVQVLGARGYGDLLTATPPAPTRTEAARAKRDNPNAKAELVEVPKGRYNSSSPGVTSLRRKINGTHSRNGIHLNRRRSRSPGR